MERTLDRGGRTREPGPFLPVVEEASLHEETSPSGPAVLGEAPPPSPHGSSPAEGRQASNAYLVPERQLILVGVWKNMRLHDTRDPDARTPLAVRLRTCRLLAAS